MVENIIQSKLKEIEDKSVKGLPNTVTGKPDIVKNAIYDPVNIVVTEVNRIVAQTNNELVERDTKITENKNLIEKNTTDISNIFSKLIGKVYPIGAIYMSTVLTSPAELFGGMWEQLTGDAYFKIVTSGAGTTAGTSSNHKIPIESMPAHAHIIDCVTSINTAYPENNAAGTTYDGARNQNQRTYSSGGSQPYYPYYYGVYAWRRTA